MLTLERQACGCGACREQLVIMARAWDEGYFSRRRGFQIETNPYTNRKDPCLDTMTYGVVLDSLEQAYARHCKHEGPCGGPNCTEPI